MNPRALHHGSVSILDFNHAGTACFSFSFGLEGKVLFLNGQLFAFLFLNLFVWRKIEDGWGGETGSNILLQLKVSVPEGCKHGDIKA